MVEKKKKSGGPEEEWHISSENKSFNFSWRTFWAYTGPGWLMSMAYLDPGNLEADLQSGAYAKYELLYVVLLSTIVGGLYQILAARLGTCTGKHLAQLCRDEYSPKVSFCLWIMTELAIIGSDVQEVLGSAIAFEILFSLPLWAGCILTGLDTLTFLAIHQIDHKSDNTTNKVVVTKKSANYLEMFFMGLIGTMCVCFFVDFGLSEPNGKEIAQGIFVPEMKERNIMQAVGTIGAIIMPHNIFLHSALVQSRHINPYHHEKIKEANLYFGMEAAVALCVSFFINAAVICVFAGTFYSTECASLTSINSSHLFGTGIQTACIPSQVALQSGANIYDAKNGKICIFHDNQIALTKCTPCHRGGVSWMLTQMKVEEKMLFQTGFCQEIGLAEAGEAIQVALGKYATIIWAIGLLASGQASTMTGTYAGQFVMEGFLNIRIVAWKRVALTRSVALVPAVAVALMTQSQQFKSDKFNEFLNILQSIQLPFALIPLLFFTSNPSIMGHTFANSKTVSYLMILATTLLCGVNFVLVYRVLKTFFTNQDHTSSWHLGVQMVFVVFLLVLYGCFIFYLAVILPFRQKREEQGKKNKFRRATLDFSPSRHHYDTSQPDQRHLLAHEVR